MSTALYLILALVLTFAAFTAAMLGIGGGVLYTPLQVMFGIDIHVAATTSLLLIVLLSLGATIIYGRARRVDWRLAFLLEFFTAAGGFAGGYLSNFVSSTTLTIILGVVLATSGVTMFGGEPKTYEHHVTGRPWYVWNRELMGERYYVNMLIAFPVSFIAGVMSGLIGIGGGVIKVPMMVILLGVPVDIAIATSAFMVGMTALGGFAGHIAVGHFDWRMTLILAPGVIVGAKLGAISMLRMGKGLLRRIFGVFILLVALGVLIKLIV